MVTFSWLTPCTQTTRSPRGPGPRQSNTAPSDGELPASKVTRLPRETFRKAAQGTRVLFFFCCAASEAINGVSLHWPRCKFTQRCCRFLGAIQKLATHCKHRETLPVLHLMIFCATHSDSLTVLRYQCHATLIVSSHPHSVTPPS